MHFFARIKKMEYKFESMHTLVAAAFHFKSSTSFLSEVSTVGGAVGFHDYAIIFTIRHQAPVLRQYLNIAQNVYTFIRTLLTYLVFLLSSTCILS